MGFYLSAAAAVYAAGVYLSQSIPLTFTIQVLLIYALIIIPAGAVRKHFPTMLIYVMLFTAGAAAANYRLSEAETQLGDYANMYVTAEGRISQTPESAGDGYRYTVDVRRVTLNGKTQDLRETIMLRADDKYSYGDSISFSGFIKALPEKLNESGFDVKLYYKSKGIFYKCYADKTAPLEYDIHDYSAYALAAGLKNGITQIIDKYTIGDRNAVLKAILTGNKKEFSEDFEIILNKTGTMRFFYPTYLHIYFIVSVIGLLSTVIKKSIKETLIIALLVLYAIFESTKPIALKGSVLMIMVILYKRRRGFLDFSDAVSLTVLIAGALNPLILYDAGFIISVAASAMISLFYKSVCAAVDIRNGYVRRSVSMGVVCTTGLLPLTAYYFNGLTAYTIITSVLFIPLTAVIIILSPILLFLVAVFSAAPIVGQIMESLLWLYTKLPYAADLLPFSYIALPRPALITIAAFYAAIGAWYAYKRLKNPFVGNVFISIAAVLFFVTASGQAARIGTMEVTFVNVGQGDGAFIRTPFREVVLMDGGGGTEYDSDYDPGKSIYLPYLEAEGIYNVDCAVVSHCHKDHVQGIIAAVKSLRVHDIYMPKLAERNEMWDELYNAAQKYGTEIHTVTDDTVLRFKSGMNIRLTVSGMKNFEDENDSSLLAEVSYGDSMFSFTGDMTMSEEYSLIGKGAVHDTDVLKVAHHGSAKSTGSDFLRLAAPEWAVISAGEGNSYGLPSAETLERLDGIEILRTDINGDIKFIADKNGIKRVETYKE